ncbi:MAG: hypothetical protein WCK27_00775 [Verrucomicrobiota bacterium]
MGTTPLPKAAPPAKPWRGVFFEGPESDQDREGDEISVWFVYVGDKEAEPVGKVYRCNSFAPAQSLAQRMAKDRRLELIHEAMATSTRCRREVGP